MAADNQRHSRILTLQCHQNTSVPRAANLSRWAGTAVDGVTRRNSVPTIESLPSFGLSSHRKKRTRDNPHYLGAEASENHTDRTVTVKMPSADAYVELASQRGVRGEQFAQVYEGAHDVETHLDGTGAVEDRGGHDGAVFSEGEWRKSRVAVLL